MEMTNLGSVSVVDIHCSEQMPELCIRRTKHQLIFCTINILLPLSTISSEGLNLSYVGLLVTILIVHCISFCVSVNYMYVTCDLYIWHARSSCRLKVNITDQIYCLQCFDTVGWVAGRASGL